MTHKKAEKELKAESRLIPCQSRLVTDSDRFLIWYYLSFDKRLYLPVHLSSRETFDKLLIWYHFGKGYIYRYKRLYLSSGETFGKLLIWYYLSFAKLLYY